MKNIINATIIVLTVSLLFSCQQYKSPYFNEILKSQDGNLRGAIIGTSQEDVKTREDGKFLKDQIPEYLHYDYQINMGNSYTVTYDFSEENELYEVEIAIYLDVVEDATVLFQDFTKYFNNEYKNGVIDDDGYSTWNTKSTLSDSKVSISIKNDSENYGFITIIVRDLDF